MGPQNVTMVALTLPDEPHAFGYCLGNFKCSGRLMRWSVSQYKMDSCSTMIQTFATTHWFKICVLLKIIVVAPLVWPFSFWAVQQFMQG